MCLQSMRMPKHHTHVWTFSELLPQKLKHTSVSETEVSILIRKGLVWMQDFIITKQKPHPNL